MSDLAKLAAQWADSLVGIKVSGTATDPESGDTRDYHLLCTRVSYGGFGDRIAITWDDKRAGSFRRLERTADDLSGLTSQDVADALEATVQAELAAKLEQTHYDALEGEAL